MRDHGVVKAHLFGSFAHGAARPDSDIDLLVAFAEPGSFFDELRLADELQRLSGRSVDVMTEIHPVFAPYILPTLIPLPI